MRKVLLILGLLAIANLILPFIPVNEKAIAAETYGAVASNNTGDLIAGLTGNTPGGTPVYTDQVNPAAATFTVATRAQLLTALTASVAGNIIYVTAGSSIDLSADWSLTLKAGVTLASNRGSAGASGALIYTNNADTTATRNFINIGSGARITGLRIRGNDQTVGTNGTGGYCGLVKGSSGAFEIDNCEVYGFAYLGISAANGATGDIHHNYIHHNQRSGLGYGVLVHNATATIYANYFDYNRHDISGSRDYPVSNYEAYYNISGTHHIGTCFDMHGGNDNPSWGFADGPDASVPAGGTIKIHHNTFMDTNQPSVSIRGVPSVGCYVYNNWTYWPSWQYTACFKQWLENLGLTPYQSMYVYNNWYSDDVDPGDPPPDVPPIPPAPVTDDEGLLASTDEDWPAYRDHGNHGVCMLSDGTFWSVFIEDDAFGTPGIAAIHYELDGTVLATENVSCTNKIETFPSIAVDSDDNLHVTYFEDTDGNAYYINRDDATGTWGVPVLLSDVNDCWNQGVGVAVDSQDYIHVVYGEDSDDALSDDPIYYRKSTDGGATFSVSLRISPLFSDPAWDDDFWPNIVVDKADNLHVVWEGYGRGPVNFSDYQIHYIQYCSDNADWCNYYEVTQDSIGPFMRPLIAVDLNNTCHISFADPFGWLSAHGVVYITRSSAGTWSGTTDASIGSATDLYINGMSLSVSGDVFIFTVDANNLLTLLAKDTPTWDCSVNIENNPLLGDADYDPSPIWAMWPEIDGLRSNYPGTGYLIHYGRDIGATGEMRFLAGGFGYGPPVASCVDDFTAYPNGCGRIDLYWDDPNDPQLFADINIVIRGARWDYPDTPPSTTDGSWEVYNHQCSLGGNTYSDTGLLSGEPYYYRIWIYDAFTDTYSLCGQDYATTYPCSSAGEAPVISEWFQEPTCEMYYQTVLWPAMNYALRAYEFPERYFCMMMTYFLISVCCIASFPVAAVAGQGSPKTMVVPFAIGAVLIVVAALAGALALGISIVSFIILAGVAVFIWMQS